MASRTTASLPRSGFLAPSYAERAEEDLSIYTGDTFGREFTWISDGEPVSLSGWTGVAVLKDALGGDVLAEFTVTVTDPSEGVFVVGMDAATTAGLTPGSGVWGVTFTHTDGRVKTPVSGNVTIEQGVNDG